MLLGGGLSRAPLDGDDMEEIIVTFASSQFAREGVIDIRASLADVFPLLCPKREEQWIPGWECETIWSHSGYNEEGAIFRTTKPYGTELYWTTLQYDIENKVVDFLITAPRRYMFRFRIDVSIGNDGLLRLSFRQIFTSVSKEGNELLNRYRAEDFNARLRSLGEFINRYLQEREKH
jgi:hypothetical protein